MNTLTTRLNDGRDIPQLGLGVWQTKDDEACNAVRWALEAGYRHIDTAAIYANEESVGKGIRSVDVPREEIWVTTKLWNDDTRVGRAREGLTESLTKLGLDYVDLYLIHWPTEGRVAAWKALVALQKEGLCKSIGVSNFMPEHLAEITAASDVVPAINQIELHPYLHQSDVLDACAELGIVPEGWSPLMQGAFKEEPLFEAMGRTHGKSAAQVVIRWALQRGFVTIPKSSSKVRIAANLDVFDFVLSDTEMEALNALGRAKRFGPDPRNFDF
jgi:diketogulonate reductase-like aldo/keto reductase